MSSTFSAASGVSASASSEPECEPSPSAKSTPTAEPSCESIGPMSPVTTTSEPSPQTDCEQTESDQLMLFAGGSRARTSAAPDTKSAFAVSEAVYGKNTIDSFARYDRKSSSWKTLQRCLLAEWGTFSEIWPRAGTIVGGTAYRQRPLAPITDEIASALLPTPSTAANQRCPSMMKHPGCRRFMPTPQAGSDHWGGTWRELSGNANPFRGTPFGSTKIHPWEWEWMMGFPRDWTALEPSEIPSSRKSRKS